MARGADSEYPRTTGQPKGAPGPAPRFWAKTVEDSSLYHPLIAHSADVAAVFEALTEHGSALHDRLAHAAGSDADVERLRATLIYLSALHDLGKANHGFQDKNGPWAWDRRRWPAKGHVVPVIASMDGHGPFLGVLSELLQRLPLAGPATKDAVLTTIAHHGRPWVSDPGKRAASVWRDVWAPHPAHGRDPLAEVLRLGDYAHRWSGVDRGGTPIPWNRSLSNLFAGLLTISDWIGSTQRIFSATPEADENPDQYWESAREKARRAVRQVGVRPSVTARMADGKVYPTLFPSTFPRFEPTTLQQLVGSMDLPEPGTRIVIESETGSGKTEAVLALYARLRSGGRVDGLVFALPTRATAKAMYERVRSAVSRLHPDGAVPPISLAMGGAVAEASGSEDAALDPDLYPDEDDRAQHAWSSESHKKFFAAEVVVGTVDQVLLAGLPVKHAHMRLALMARHLVVVDEIHSYDRYMNTVLNRVLDFHAGLGGVSAFLSATLSREARNGLAGGTVELDLEQAIRAPYPALSRYNAGDESWSQVAAAADSPQKPVQWTLGSQELQGDSIFDEAIQIAEAGGRVCILRSTVREAIGTVERIGKIAPGLLWRPGESPFAPPYHSRYIPGDRLHIDSAALSDFGKGSTRRGVILVSTQVIEQSLDVDFDWMMTDLAPVDVLLQRIGRLHRHTRDSRPREAANARLLVQAPSQAFPARKELRNQGFGWGTVYGEASDLELTRRLIEARPEIVIPRDNRLLVEHVYHPDARRQLEAESADWANAVEAREGRDLALDFAGEMGALDLRRGYPDQAAQYDAARGERIRTRIGDDRISVALDRPVNGWYDRDTTAAEVPLRLDQLQRAVGVDFAEPKARFEEQTEAGPIYRIGEKLRLRYSPVGWVEPQD